MVPRIAYVAAFLLIALGSSPRASAAGFAHRDVRSARGWMSPAANAGHAWLYVAGYDNGAIFIYDVDEIGTPLIGKITDGVHGPAGITVDAHGTLYVVDQDANSVTIYPPRKTTPALTLATGLDFPNSAAIDAAGNVYVTSRNSTPASIVVFPAGSVTPSQTITNSLIVDPLQDVFDPTGDLYFTDYSTGVNEIPAGSSVPVSLGLQGVPKPAGIALDPLDGNLFVQNYQPGHYETLVYAPADVNPGRTLKDSAAANLLTIGVRRRVYLFVPDFFSNAVSVFRHDAERPLSVLTTASRGR
jgi:hypothetical protein